MIKLKTIITLSLLSLSAASALAQNLVSGTWNASASSPQGPMSIVFQLESDGMDLTGSMNIPMMGDVPISEGIVQGNEISFKVSMQGGPGGAMNMLFTGSVDGDTLTLTPEFDGASPPGASVEPLTATRGS